MNTPLLATLVASLLVGASAATLAVVAIGKDNESALNAHGAHDHGDMAGADEHALHGGWAGDAAGHDAHAQTGMARPSFPPAQGEVPTPEAAAALEEVTHIAVYDDNGFNPANGVRSGQGTLADPYVISGYYVTGDLYLGDTDACFEVKENFIAGQLSLNWNGQCVWVHHNFIRDLRVNENIPRIGYATGGLIEANQIEFIGQLRHYDGEVRNNVVGPRTADSGFDPVLEETVLLIPELLLANIDGFNQGLIHHNTFYGPVDLDLHGHHHGTGFFAPHSHYHGMDEAHTPDHMEDHTDRWTSVEFTDNKIVDEVAYGLRYEDQNHAGDDRTANSEDNEMLDMNHTHRVDVLIARNTIEGAQIWVDIFGADDENHEARNDGWLRIVDNTVTLKERENKGLLGSQFFFFGSQPYVEYAAILVQAAKEVEATISGNILTYVPLGQQPSDPLSGVPLMGQWFGGQEQIPAGVRIEAVRDANILVEKNTIKDFEYGIQARDMDDMTWWTVASNTVQGASYDVYYDESVANKPVER